MAGISQRFNPASNSMEVIDSNGMVISRIPVAGISQSALAKFQNLPVYSQPISDQPPRIQPLTAEERDSFNPNASFNRTAQTLRNAFSEPQPEIPEQTPTLQPQPEASYGVDPRSIAGGFSQIKEGLRRAGELEAAAADTKANVLEEFSKRAQEQQLQNEERERDRLQKLKEMQNEYKALSDDIRNTRIDPNRYYATRSTGQKVSTAIGLALSGLADAGAVFAGRGRTDNFDRALGIINQAVDRDIALQKFQFDQKRGQASDKLTLYGIMNQQFGDERAAEQATKLFMMEDVRNQLLATDMKFKSPQVRANTQQLLGRIAIEQQDRQEILSANHLANLYKAQELAIKAKELSAGKIVPSGEAARIGDVNASISILEDLERSYFGDEKYKTEAKVGLLSGLTQYAPGNVSSARQYRDEARQAAQMIGTALEGGKLTDKDYPRYLAMLPTAGDSEERAKNKIEALKRKLLIKKKKSIGALQGAGYNTGNLGPSESATDFILNKSNSRVLGPGE